MSSRVPTGCLIAAVILGLLGVSLSAWLLPFAMLLFAVAIMLHVNEVASRTNEDFADMRKRIGRLEQDGSRTDDTEG